MQPLSKKFRRSFFWLLTVVFIVGTPILIGYSKGYRIGDALSLVETGGIYIHSDVARTTVYINGKFVENNGTFLKNTFIQDLPPNKTYEVWVVREGYQSWTKVLPVQPNLVTEARTLMVPETLTWRTIPATTTVHVTRTVVPGNASTSTVATTSEVANPEHIKMNDFFENWKDQFAVEVATSTHILTDNMEIATTSTIIEYRFPDWFNDFASTTELLKKEHVRERDGVVAWLDHGDLYAAWGRKNDPAPYFFCNESCTTYTRIDWEEPILYYEFYPQRNDVVIALTPTGIYAVELDIHTPRNIQTIMQGTNLMFHIKENDSLVVRDNNTFKVTTW